MPVAVPGQRCHPVAELQAQCVQRVGHLAGALPDLRVIGAVDIALHPARNNLAVAVVPLRKIDQRCNQERLVLHESEHQNNSIKGPGPLQKNAFAW